MYVSEPALHRSCCRSSKQDGSASLCMWHWHGWATRVTCQGLYIRQFAGYPQGLEAPPRTSASHLASDPGSRPSEAQSWPELSTATRPGQRTLEAARGNGYALVRGTPVMMMMNTHKSGICRPMIIDVYYRVLIACRVEEKS